MKKNPDGTFAKGNEGGAARRNKQYASKVYELAAEFSVEAIHRLAAIVRNGNDRDAVKAANIILDRAFGKPSQHVHFEEDNPDNRPKFVIEYVSNNENTDS